LLNFIDPDWPDAKEYSVLPFNGCMKTCAVGLLEDQLIVDEHVEPSGRVQTCGEALMEPYAAIATSTKHNIRIAIAMPLLAANAHFVRDIPSILIDPMSVPQSFDYGNGALDLVTLVGRAHVS